MAEFLLPVFQDPSYDVTVDLDRVAYRFRYKYNARDSAWYFDLFNADGSLARGSIRVVENFPLLRLMQTLDRPEGEIIVVSTQGLERPPLLEELGEVFVPIYLGDS